MKYSVKRWLGGTLLNGYSDVLDISAVSGRLQPVQPMSWQLAMDVYSRYRLRRRLKVPQGKIAPVIVKAACPYCRGDVSRGYKHAEGFQKCLSLTCHRTSWWSWAAQFPELQVKAQEKLWTGDGPALRPNRNHYER
jgi:hypothetical protein